MTIPGITLCRQAAAGAGHLDRNILFINFTAGWTVNGY